MTVLIVRYIAALNGCIVSDINPNNWSQILALFAAESTVSERDKKALVDATPRFMTSPPMTLTAKYDEMAGQVHVTLGRNSYKMSAWDFATWAVP